MPKTEPKNRYCHCGRLTAYSAADYDQRMEWLRMNRAEPGWYWLTMPQEFCTLCWNVRCDAYPGACWDHDDEETTA